MKWRAPTQVGSLIERPALLERLDAAVSRKLVLLRAPAGFGKTTLLAQWTQRLPDACIAWLTLDESDSETLQLLRELVLCLAASGASMGQLEALAAQDFLDVQRRSILRTLLDRIGQLSRRTIVILEDFHRAQSADVTELVRELLAAAPDNLTLVITSRLLPAINIAQLVAAGQGVEIDAQDLRFSLAETGEVAGSALSPVTIQCLFDQTEGWPIAVQLARLLLRDECTSAEVVDKLSRHSEHIATYLTDQVFATMDADMQHFLLYTSVLERFSASLADAVCERTDCWDLIRKAHSLHALLVPLDESGEWFRYHHLFGECLRDLLRRKYADRMSEANLRASCWYERNGYLPEAVLHARLAGDVERAATLIEDAGGWQLMLYKGIGYVGNLLKLIPEQKLHAHPALLVARSYLNVKQGHMREARATFELALAQSEHKRGSTGLQRALLNVGTILSMFDDAPLESLEPYRKFVAGELRIDTDDFLTLALVDLKRAISSLGAGRFEDADRSVRSATSSMRRADSILGLNYCYIQSGVSALYQGQLQAAVANFEEAKRLANENFGADSTVKGYADVLSGVAAFYQGELTPALQADFLAALNFVSGNDGSFDIYASGFEVAVALAIARTDGAADAVRLVEEMHKLAAAFGNLRLRHVASALELIVKTSTGDRSGVARLVIDTERAFLTRDGESSTWRVKYVVGLALATYYGLIDRSKAIALIDRVITLCRTINARLHLIQALMIRGELLDLAGQRAAALNDCFEALRLAAAEHVRQPFLRKTSLLPLLRAAQRRARVENVDILSITFLAGCIDSLAELASTCPAPGDDAALSPREMEVMAELSRGLSNKEIARALDVTENTVKYHLKNIFTKINAETRTQAISLIRERDAGRR